MGSAAEQAHTRRATRSEEHLRRAVQKAVGERYVASNPVTAEPIGVDLKDYGWML